MQVYVIDAWHNDSARRQQVEWENSTRARNQSGCSLLNFILASALRKRYAKQPNFYLNTCDIFIARTGGKSRLFIDASLFCCRFLFFYFSNYIYVIFLFLPFPGDRKFKEGFESFFFFKERQSPKGNTQGGHGWKANTLHLTKRWLLNISLSFSRLQKSSRGFWQWFKFKRDRGKYTWGGDRFMQESIQTSCIPVQDERYWSPWAMQKSRRSRPWLSKINPTGLNCLPLL